MQKSVIYFASLLILVAFLISGLPLSKSAGDQTSTLKEKWAGYSKVRFDGKNTLYLLEEQKDALTMIKLKKGDSSRTIALPKHANGVAFSKDNKTCFVTSGVSFGVLSALYIENGDIAFQLPVGHYPVSPVMDSQQNRIYLLNRFAGLLTVVDIPEQEIIKQIQIGREPSACVLSRNNKMLVIAHSLPEQPATADMVAAKMTFVDTESLVITKQILLPNGSSATRDIICSPDGRFVFVPHHIARYNLPTTQLERGWMNTNALSIIDMTEQKLYASVLLDDIDQGAANPWGVDCTPVGRYLCISHAGTHEVSIIDLPILFEKLSTITFDPQNRLGFLENCRYRVKTTGHGPRGICATDDRIFVANYFSDSIDIIDLEDRSVTSTIQKHLPLLAQHQMGEYYFHNATSCFQGWQSCASCHPDARTDGFNWDLLNDYIGNPKNAKSLLYSHLTPPMNWTGIRPSAEASVRAGMLHIQFNIVDELEAEAIDTYLQMLDLIPSPFLNDDQFDPAALRGKKLFEDQTVGCKNCHPQPLYTDQRRHAVGTHSILDSTINAKGKAVPQIEFDTPSLVEAWRTAPYLHDGRYATIKDVITVGNHGDSRGKTSHLSKKEISDLVKYIKSL